MEKNKNRKIVEPESLELNFSKIDIPEKLFFKIGEVAGITGLKPYVLRFWETEFEQLSPEKASNNQRKYTRKEIETLLIIKELLYGQKYTIDGAKQKLKEMKALGQRLAPAVATETKTEYQQSPHHIREEIITIRNELKSGFTHHRPPLKA